MKLCFAAGSAAALFVLGSCGKKEEKKPVAIAQVAPVEIRLGEEFSFDGALAKDGEQFRLQRQFYFTVESEMNLVLRESSVASMCDAGEQISDALLQLKGRNSELKLSSATQDGYRVVEASNYPGIVPADTFDLAITYSSSAGCQILGATYVLEEGAGFQPFSFPQPEN